MFDLLAQVTEDDVWLYRAARFGEWLTELVRPEQNIPDRPLSLFEGIAGAVHFLHDLIEKVGCSWISLGGDFA